MKNLVFVDCEAWGGCPAVGDLTEFGAVAYGNGATFHGVLVKTTPDPTNPAIPVAQGKCSDAKRYEVFLAFLKWLEENVEGHPVFISDNPAFDWQWINDGFWRSLGHNPFGHSARRIGDFYAGLVGDFTKASKWKKLRVTKHDHNPVHDALGNVEAFRRMLKGDR